VRHEDSSAWSRLANQRLKRVRSSVRSTRVSGVQADSLAGTVACSLSAFGVDVRHDG
jgi:hypothetical protein